MKIQSDVSLAPWCTLGVGGPARWFCQATSEKDITDALVWARARDAAVHILGGGSNVVIADEGFGGLVVQVDIRGVDRSQAHGNVLYNVGAGEPWDPFVAGTVNDDCAGLECLSGIPGLVGGTPIQNVGAYGQDVSETITRVHVLDRQTGSMRPLSSEECGFAYRTSRFKRQERFVVTRVEYALIPQGSPRIAYADVVSFFAESNRRSPTLAAVREAILQIRRRKGMVIEDGNPANRSVGSFFVNPVISCEHFKRLQAEAKDTSVPHYAAGSDRVKVPAAWLIERAGYPKGFRRGRVGVSPFQAVALVNYGAASARDIVELATDIKRAVWKMFEVSIVPEPVFVGFQHSPEVEWLIAG